MCMPVTGPVRFENSKEKIADVSSPDSRKLAVPDPGELAVPCERNEVR